MLSCGFPYVGQRGVLASYCVHFYLSVGLSSRFMGFQALRLGFLLCILSVAFVSSVFF
jgi:hypothetical protein